MVKVKVACVRMFQNSIDDSVKPIIELMANMFGVAHEFTFTDKKIVHNETGSTVIFKGLARNILEVKGMVDIDILWIEEAESLTKTMWGILEPTITRNEGAECWIVFNPKFATDFAYKRFVANPPPGYLVRHINYDENPFLGPDAMVGINAMMEEDIEDYNHIYLGVPLTDDERVIIKRRWLEACVNAHVKLGIEVTGSHRIGFDVADDGEDANALVYAHGVLAYECETWKGETDKLVETAHRAANAALTKDSTVYYDPIGVGAGVGSNIKQFNSLNGKRVKYHGWNAGGKIIDPDKEYTEGKLNKDMFSNAKSQAWWMIADRCRETYNAVVRGKPYDPNNIISISGDMQHLQKMLDELSTPYKDLDASGKAKVESKKDLSKRDVKSPNLADAFIMAYAPLERTAHMWAGSV
tara:strand:- start:1873 stop:3108 length:1236 start_codon:yes stop_codon:yes gene_type:complete